MLNHSIHNITVHDLWIFLCLLILNYSYQFTNIYIYIYIYIYICMYVCMCVCVCVCVCVCIILENCDSSSEGTEIHSVFVLSSLRYVIAFTYCPSLFPGFKSRASRLKFGEVVFFLYFLFLCLELSLKIVTCRNLYQETQIPVLNVENCCECPAFDSTYIATIMRRHDRKWYIFVTKVTFIVVMLSQMVKILGESFDGCYKLASHKQRGGGKYREEENHVFPIKSFQYYLECSKFLREFFSVMTLSQKFKYKRC